MRSVKLTLRGIPPSLNVFAGRENANVWRREKALWTDNVIWTIKALKVRPQNPFEKSTVAITYYFPDNRRHDPDNYSGKLFMDGLTRGGIIADDDFRHINLVLAGDVDRANPRTEIVVQEV